MDFTIPELGSTHGPAFDWLAQELVFPDAETRQRLRELLVENAGMPADRITRDLLKIWPDGIHWPGGESWLGNEACDWRKTTRNLMFLLVMRHTHVAHRLYRHAQIINMIHPQSPDRTDLYTGVIINKFGEDYDEPGVNICGIKHAQIMSIQAGLHFMRTPAHRHPECDCTIDPYRPK